MRWHAAILGIVVLVCSSLARGQVSPEELEQDFRDVASVDIMVRTSVLSGAFAGYGLGTFATSGWVAGPLNPVGAMTGTYGHPNAQTFHWVRADRRVDEYGAYFQVVYPWSHVGLTAINGLINSVSGGDWYPVTLRVDTRSVQTEFPVQGEATLYAQDRWRGGVTQYETEVIYRFVLTEPSAFPPIWHPAFRRAVNDANQTISNDGIFVRINRRPGATTQPTDAELENPSTQPAGDWWLDQAKNVSRAVLGNDENRLPTGTEVYGIVPGPIGHQHDTGPSGVRWWSYIVDGTNTFSSAGACHSAIYTTGEALVGERWAAILEQPFGGLLSLPLLMDAILNWRTTVSAWGSNWETVLSLFDFLAMFGMVLMFVGFVVRATWWALVGSDKDGV